MSALGRSRRCWSPFFPGVEVLRREWEELRRDPEAVEVLGMVRHRLEGLGSSWEEGPLMEAVRGAGKEAGARGPALFHPVRRALTAATSGPELGKVLVALGAEATLARLSGVLDAAAVP